MKTQLFIVVFGLCQFFSFSQNKSFDTLKTDIEIETALDTLENWVDGYHVNKIRKHYNAIYKAIRISKNKEYKARLDAYYAMYNCFIHNYDKFLHYTNLSLAYFESTKNKKFLIYTYNLKGIYYTYSSNDLKNAIIYFNKAIALDNGSNDVLEFYAIDSYFNLAYMYYLNKNWDLCYETTVKTIRLAKKHNKINLLARMYFCQGFAAFKTGQLQKAVNSFKKSEKRVLDYEKQSDKKIYFKDALYLYGFSELYKFKGDYKRALEYLNYYNQRVLDGNNKYSIEIGKKINRNNELLAEKEKFKKILAESQLKESQLVYNKITIGFSVVIILGLLFFLFQEFRLRKLNIEKNKVLSQKNNALISAKTKIEEALQVKVDFLNSISHELKTPLYAINSITQLIKENKESRLDDTHIDILAFSGEHLLRFINDVIETNTNGKNNEKEIVNNIFNIGELLNNIKQTVYSSLNEYKTNNNTYNFFFDDTIPKKIIGDTLKLTRIVINLLNNASKNTKNGTISLIIKQLELTSVTSKLEFSVSDTGRGISDKQLEEIYKAFDADSNLVHRVDGFSSGLGMGLVMVNRMLKLFNSELKISSTLHKGSIFTFTISLQRAEVNLISQKETFKPKAKFEVKSKILIVDDNKINQLITKKIVYSRGVACEVVNDGYAAIKALEAGKTYDFILMDIMMPGLNGYETTKIIKSKFPNQKIIALTAISVNQNLNALNAAGFDDVISKPFKLDNFYKVMNSYF